MDTSKIISRIKRGLSDEEIIEDGIRITGFFKREEGETDLAFSSEHDYLPVLLEDLRTAGFPEVTVTSRSFSRYREDVYLSSCGQGTVTITHRVYKRKRYRYECSIGVTMPDGSHWTYASYCKTIRTPLYLLPFINAWNESTYQKETLIQKIRKTRKKLQIRSTTVEGVLQHLLNARKLRYSIQRTAHGSRLYIKTMYNRYIDVRLKPDMNMEKLTELGELISSVQECIDSLGDISFEVRESYANIDWFTCP